MSVTALNWAERQKIAGPASIKSVLRAIAWAANKQGVCFPSQGTIAERSGVCERGVRDAIAVLERLGMLQRQRRSRGRHGRTTDLLSLSLHREFVVSKKDVEVARKKPAAQPATGKNNRLEVAVSESSNRQKSSFQPARLAGDTKEIRQKKSPIQEGEGLTTVSGYGAGIPTSRLPLPPWPEDLPFGVGRA